jgi:ribosomal protein S18 acetylase RimI-like enzyme
MQTTKPDFQIIKLSARSPTIAMQLYQLMQAAYKVEAGLLGVTHFFPLQRTPKKIQNSQSRFYGIGDEQSLFAAIEIVVMHNDVYIDALVVAPTHMRQGLGTALLTYVIQLYPEKSFIVQTAKANYPGISFYQKCGFLIVAELNSPDGLPLVSLKKIDTFNL